MGSNPEYGREWRRRNPEKQRLYEQRARDRKQKRCRDVVAALKSVPCADCGVQYPPYVMDFDHLPGTEKVGDVSTLANQGVEKKMLAEIAKCEVVCANCHRIRTHERKTRARAR